MEFGLSVRLGSASSGKQAFFIRRSEATRTDGGPFPGMAAAADAAAGRAHEAGNQTAAPETVRKEKRGAACGASQPVKRCSFRKNAIESGRAASRSGFVNAVRSLNDSRRRNGGRFPHPALLPESRCEKGEEGGNPHKERPEKAETSSGALCPVLYALPLRRAGDSFRRNMAQVPSALRIRSKQRSNTSSRRWAMTSSMPWSVTSPVMPVQ